jgi:GH25 family lysozyme M1 (1,4-beta-N-acetylmuramidase)
VRLLKCLGRWSAISFFLLFAVSNVSACDNGADVPDDKCQYFVRFIEDGKQSVDGEISKRLTGNADDPAIRSIALIVTVSEYPRFSRKEDRLLQPAENDRRNLIDFFKRQNFDEVIVLNNADASRENIIYFLEAYLPETADARSGRARIVFAYSGHGGPGVGNGPGSLILSTARGVGDAAAVLKLNILAPILKNLAEKSFHFVALLGSCYSGGIFDNASGGGMNFWSPRARGAHVISATAADDLAYGLGNDRGSLFFDALIDGVTTGRADYNNAGIRSLEDGSVIIVGGGIVPLGSLAGFISKQLGELVNPETNKPFPQPRIGSLITQAGWDGAFFFLVPPMDQLALRREITGSAVKGNPEVKVFNAPDTYQIIGMDVSRWSGTVDWKKAKSKGIRFAYIKATEGKTLTDKLFTDNWNASGSAGIVRGAYHVFNFCRGAPDQFGNIIKNVPRASENLPVAIDLGWYDDGPISKNQKKCKDIPAIQKNLKELLSMLTRYYGKLPVIFAHEKGISQILSDKFDDYPLWLQNWTKDGSPSDMGPSLSGRNPWSLWQFSGNTPFGGSTNVDLNAFFGTVEEFEAFRESKENVALQAAQPFSAYIQGD